MKLRLIGNQRRYTSTNLGARQSHVPEPGKPWGCARCHELLVTGRYQCHLSRVSVAPYTCPVDILRTGELSMRRTRFCSACGERIKTRSVSLAVLGLLCPRCSPNFRRERALSAGVFLLCLSIVFAIARYTAPREPFHFIGTRVESNPGNLASAIEPASPSGVANVPPPLDERSVSAESRLSQSLCGGPTKSGRPCQRRVKAGGYCWQHRDKIVAHKPSPNGR